MSCRVSAFLCHGFPPAWVTAELESLWKTSTARNRVRDGFGTYSDTSLIFIGPCGRMIISPLSPCEYPFYPFDGTVRATRDRYSVVLNVSSGSRMVI
jgi:hypothetical protein